jgi:CMP-N-acetylneuraminic acid synthetase
MKKKKCIGFIPVKKNSTRLPSKNFLKFGNKKLYQYFILKVIKSNLDDVYVNTDSEEVIQWCKKNNIKYLVRPDNLSFDSANGNDLLMFDASKINSDVYFQLFVTSPFLKIKTINEAISIIKKNNKYDCIFTAEKMNTWFWYKNRPLNYNPKVLPRSQDSTFVVKETTGLYAIKKNSLKKNRSRIGSNPYMLFVNKVESLDIDEQIDYEIAKKLYGLSEKNFN